MHHHHQAHPVKYHRPTQVDGKGVKQAAEPGPFW